MEAKKSSIIRIRGLSTISCADNYQNTKTWWAQKINPDDDTVIGSVSMASLDTSKAELNIPSNFLDLGLYKIYYKMMMDGTYGAVKFEAETFTYVNVVASELIGVMLRGGVSRVERGDGQTLDLQPLDHSTDPDVDASASQGLTVDSWVCHEADDTTANCDAIGFDSSGSPATQTLTISAGVVGKTYMVRARLAKDTRLVDTEVYLAAVSGFPPFISIIPAAGSVYYQLSDGFKVLQSSRLALDCICENCSPTDNLAYFWTVYSDDYRWPYGWRKLNTDDMIDRVFGKWRPLCSSV
ncbi:location of vulva defective 1 [Elysia marginata]|uniref:Location of vulva defective 1 n=1 Tax=Elysia marginata TaxID=1093978 RepID=A0AAV4F033_9GAST|nr:location of vulva defective 1 [Elysia marginata]